ncbi:MAG: hypothetical protein QXU32_03415 [Nitrososphaerales archaeon]
MPFWFGRGKTAKNLVKEWERTQVSNIVRDIVRIIPERAPFLRDIAASSLSDLINKNLEFSISEPEAISGNTYSVIDTIRVKVGPGIPLIGKQFTISMNYNLRVNVKEKRVDATPDISSLKIDFV